MTNQVHPIDSLCINTIRTLSIDAIEKANSGHPGLPMGAAPMAYVLWKNHLRHNPADPNWSNRDRFVLSAGHGSMLLYALLHLTGYHVKLEDIEDFRQWGSSTPGHPESFLTPGVEATTGPLGQGTANGVGMAIAERFLAQYFNREGYDLVDHHTYVLAGDGDLMEGLSAEAASLAGHLNLGKLIMLYDSNDVSLDGPTDLSFTEDVGKRYEAYGWHVVTVQDGDHDLTAIDHAIHAAKYETQKPSLIIVKTTIGYGSPAKQGTSNAHGAPLGPEETRATKENLDWDFQETFHVPAKARDHFREAIPKGQGLHQIWKERFEEYSAKFPHLAETWHQAHLGTLPPGWDKALPDFEPNSKMATRVSSGKVLNALAKQIPFLLGGDADLSCSTKTLLSDCEDFNGQTGKGRNIRYGVREHAMGAIANGIGYHGGLKTFTATFFCFSDYMRPAIRLAALSGLPTIFVFTHDSVAVGEDGPTHQPVEHLASMRAIPNHLVIRPADATEAAEAWCVAMSQTKRPTSLVLSRQGLPTLDRSRFAPASQVRKGAYVLSDPDDRPPEIILIATGSEVSLALEVQATLDEKGIAARVVSMPSWELFQEQRESYQEKVLPPGIPNRIAIEAGSSFGWSRWLGPWGRSISLDRFGASAPGGETLKRFGFNRDHILEQVEELLKK